MPQNKNRLEFQLVGLLKSSAEGLGGICGLIAVVLIVLGFLSLFIWLTGAIPTFLLGAA